MLPPDHSRRTCPSCGADLLFRADLQPDLLVVYSSLCLECAGGTVPLATVEASTAVAAAGQYWPKPEAVAAPPSEHRAAWWDRSSWNALTVWGRLDPVLPVQRTLGPVSASETQPAPERPREATTERRPRAPHIPHPIVTRLPTVEPVAPDESSADATIEHEAEAEAEASSIASDLSLWEEMDARAEGSPDSFAFSLPTRGRHARRRKPVPSQRSRVSA